MGLSPPCRWRRGPLAAAGGAPVAPYVAAGRHIDVKVTAARVR